MFEQNEELAAKVDSLVSAVDAKSRGDVITHKEISEILECAPYEGCWGAAVEKMKKRVESELGITLMSVREVGYELLPIAAQFDIAPRMRITRAIRQVGKGIKHVTAPIVEEIPEHLQRQRAFVQEGLRRRRSDLHGESIKQGIFAAKPTPEPRIRFFPPES